MSRWPTQTRHSKTTFGQLTRSQLMSRVRSAGNVTTELKLLRLLHAHKIRGWRRNYPLIGKPDFVFPAVRVVVFVDGCFWHGHNCGRNLTPRKNVAQWKAKIRATESRDRRIRHALRQRNWKVITIWECSLRRNTDACVRRIERIVARKSRAR